MPPLSKLDKAIYFVIMLLIASGFFWVVVGWGELHKRIAFRDPAVIACNFGYFGIFPLMLILVVDLIALGICYENRRPIFGNKMVRYGEYPWKTDLFPLFGPQSRLSNRRPSEQRFRTAVIRIAIGFILVMFLLSSLGLYRRTCLMEDRTIVKYNSLNRTSEPISISRDCNGITIWARKETPYRGGRPVWHYGIIIFCENGKKQEFKAGDFNLRHRGHTDCLKQLLAIKALFSADQITIEGSNLLPDVIEHNHLDESQAKLLEALFAPP